MTKTEDGKLDLKHTSRIDIVLEAMGLDSKMTTNKWIPAEPKTLTKDKDGEAPPGTLSYTVVLLECSCICRDTVVLP